MKRDNLFFDFCKKFQMYSVYSILDFRGGLAHYGQVFLLLFVLAYYSIAIE